MPNNLCIIPARGGSKRILRKNIKPFFKKPIIAYAIETALNSGLFDEVMVSTEDEEIAKIASKFGANIPFYRSLEMANDFATTKDVTLEVVKKYLDIGVKYNNLCCIYPTSILMTVEDLVKGYSLLNEHEIALPATKFSYPPQRCFHKIDNNRLVYTHPENIQKRSQDLMPLYHDAGQWYWQKIETLSKLQHEINRGFVELPNLRVQDIDTYEDWEMAKIKYNRFIKNK
jgi:pseudaminic acid cytidylyltransferase